MGEREGGGERDRELIDFSCVSNVSEIAIRMIVFEVALRNIYHALRTRNMLQL